MAAPRNRRHLLVPTAPNAEAYRPHPRAIGPATFARPEDREAHARALTASLKQATQDISQRREAVGIEVPTAKPGIYIQFESPPGVDLKLESLEDRRRGIELVAVQSFQPQPDAPAIQRASVFVPEGSLKHFFNRFAQYETEVTEKGEPRHKEMVDRIASLRRATMRALWTDDDDLFPDEDEPIWWELWLRRHDGNELERLSAFAQQADLSIGERRLAFDDRIVVLANGTAAKLSGSLEVLNDLAEVRRAKQSAVVFLDAPAEEQVAHIDQLKQRTTPPPANAPAACLLDSGVTRAHPLLEHVIDVADATAVNPAWGGHDDGGGDGVMGHGTEMAGLTAYGDLGPLLGSNDPVVLRHRIESVKILPPQGANEPELYGAVTAEAVARPEIESPQRARVFALAVTARDQRDRGQPTSWSAALDALSAGRAFDPTTGGLTYLEAAEQGTQRLFVVSAGNVSTLQPTHLERSDLESVHDPAQAWNVLSVGAHTERAVITDPDWDGWSPLAAAGDLSPWSTTSVVFQEFWPTKPDVVFEGGNIGRNGNDVDFPIPDLCLLSTHYKPQDNLFVLSYATSAATAQVTRMAAILRAEYAAYWPETVRALIVHSARWTRAMEAHLRGAGGKRARAKLVRRYGFGVPNLQRAIRSADDSLTLISQSTIRPFNDGKMREMHLHSLPWPKDALEGLGETPVRLRITLSYFIEPNPGRRGWTRRHRYASHGLRFDAKSATETPDDFRKRLNEQALAEDEEKPEATTDSQAWYLGPEARNRGSLHSDIWVGTAADLADRGMIGVYPVSGWWKDQPKRDRSEIGARYSLVVSIETDAQGVDIWTPVAQQIGVPIEQTLVEL